ncbi:hypothetical protein TNCV_1381681 [Trichonephila clavipes]|nr:hypothetical protein TNCV_1381681 [Trichonephila clavipes]
MRRMFSGKETPIVTLSLSLLPPGVSRAPRSTCPRTGPMLSLWRLHAPTCPRTGILYLLMSDIGPFPGYFLDDKQYHSRARSVGVYNPMTD